MGAPQELLNHEVPDYLVSGTDLFPLDCQIKNNDISQQTVGSA